MRNKPFSCIKCPSIIKLSFFPKMNSRFRTIFIKIPIPIFEELDKIILKFKWKTKVPRKQRLLKKKTMEGLILPGNQATIINLMYGVIIQWLHIKLNKENKHLWNRSTYGTLRDRWHCKWPRKEVDGAKRLNCPYRKILNLNSIPHHKENQF